MQQPSGEFNADGTLSFGAFDSIFLKCSEKWLSEPELSTLIDSGPFSKERQLAWYATLPNRDDYRIWGVSLAGVPVGAVGLKAIGQGAAEYFGYLGDKSCWGKGLGPQLLDHAESEARSIGVKVLRLRVLDQNIRAIRLYQKADYHFCTKPDANSVMMVKFLPPTPQKKS